MSNGKASAFPLAMAREGERVRVVRLQRGERMARRLAEMGLALGTEAVLLRRGGEGPVLVAVGDARIAIGQSMASRVMVELV
jgi:Fe2+ transport system protein FeoA